MKEYKVIMILARYNTDTRQYLSLQQAEDTANKMAQQGWRVLSVNWDRRDILITFERDK